MSFAQRNRASKITPSKRNRGTSTTSQSAQTQPPRHLAGRHLLEHIVDDVWCSCWRESGKWGNYEGCTCGRRLEEDTTYYVGLMEMDCSDCVALADEPDDTRPFPVRCASGHHITADENIAEWVPVIEGPVPWGRVVGFRHGRHPYLSHPYVLDSQPW